MSRYTDPLGHTLACINSIDWPDCHHDMNEGNPTTDDNQKTPESIKQSLRRRRVYDDNFRERSVCLDCAWYDGVVKVCPRHTEALRNETLRATLQAGRTTTDDLVAIDKVLADTFRLQAQVNHLADALRFYADAEVLYLGKGDYKTTLEELICDNGATARNALANIKWGGPKIEIRNILLTYTDGRTEEWTNE